MHPMTKLPIKVKYVNGGSEVHMPREGDLGIDLYANEDILVPIGEARLVSTGLCIEMPTGYAVFFKDRSSFSKYGHVMAGVIDNSWRGECKVRMFAHTPNYHMKSGLLSAIPCVKIDRGDRIAQAVIVSDFTSSFFIEEVEELSTTERGGQGFGSTGK